ncbi:hypothetical protein AaE_004271 [Aphanomyces astaci]|uniref:Cyclic nucleotide-binding domain-containing protein n=1 Tax=Aphanomyces astaci TaxID=112090 RepID=A0A6A5AN38_APHAT|nr:hypothetical protein AaE_004271 [Aphanomyces astaci]
METTTVKSLLEEDAAILVDIKKELQDIHLMMETPSQHAVRPGSPLSSSNVEVAASTAKQLSIRKRFKTAVRQLVFMEKTKDKVHEAYESESVSRLRNMPTLSLLCAVPLFQTLDGAALMDLNAHVQVTSHAANSTIFAKGLDTCVYIIRCGTAWVKAPGKERTSGEFHHDDVVCESGDIVDPVEFLDKNDQFKCVAVGLVDALAIPREVYTIAMSSMFSRPLLTQVLLKYKDHLPRLSDSLHSVRYINKAVRHIATTTCHSLLRVCV